MMHRFKGMQQSIPPAPTANSLTHATVNASCIHVPLSFFELTPRYKHFMSGMTNSQGLVKRQTPSGGDERRALEQGKKECGLN